MIVLRVIVYAFCLCMLQGSVFIWRVCRLIACLFSCLWFVCFACMLVLRVVVYAFATVCCNVTSQISHLCRLHACIAFVCLFCVVWLFALF